MFFKSKNEKIIEQVQEFFNSIPNINAGGCGIAALGLYDTAVKEGKDPKIIFFYHKIWEERNFDHNQMVMEGKKDKAMSCCHIVCEIDGKYINKKNDRLLSEILSEEINFYKQYVTRELLINSLIHGGWNQMFEREKWWNKIKTYLGWNDIEIPTKYIGSGKYVFA